MILLDARVSVVMYPGDLWSLYIERQVRGGNYQKSLALIERF